MLLLVRLVLAVAAAMSLGYAWTVGQTGLKQTNRNLCELWANLPLPPYGRCEFHYALIVLWLVVAAAIVLWLGIEAFLRRRAIKRLALSLYSAVRLAAAYVGGKTARIAKRVDPYLIPIGLTVIVLGVTIVALGAWRARGVPTSVTTASAAPAPATAPAPSPAETMYPPLSEGMRPISGLEVVRRIENLEAERDARAAELEATKNQLADARQEVASLVRQNESEKSLAAALQPMQREAIPRPPQQQEAGATPSDNLLPSDVAPVNEALSRFHGIVKSQLIDAINQIRRDLPDGMTPIQSYSDTLEKLQRDFAALEEADRAIDTVFKDAKFTYYRDSLAKVVPPSGYKTEGRNFNGELRGLLESLETIAKRHSRPDVDMNAVVLTLTGPVRESMQKYDRWASDTVRRIEDTQRELRKR